MNTNTGSPDSPIKVNVNLEAVPINKVMARVEAEALNLAMQAARYNQSKAARLLEISRGTLRTKLNLYYPGVFIDPAADNKLSTK